MRVPPATTGTQRSNRCATPLLDTPMPGPRGRIPEATIALPQTRPPIPQMSRPSPSPSTMNPGMLAIGCPELTLGDSPG